MKINQKCSKTKICILSFILLIVIAASALYYFDLIPFLRPKDDKKVIPLELENTDTVKTNKEEPEEKQLCPDYETPTIDNNLSKTSFVCLPPKCDSRSIITKAGGCHPCPDYKITTKDKMYCETPKCQSNQIISKDGSCTSCGDFTVTAFDMK